MLCIAFMHQLLLIKSFGIIASTIISKEIPEKSLVVRIWQAFVQESIHSIAAASEINLELQDNLAIDDVTKQAFSILD